MKKVIMAAMMFLATSTAFAGDSEPLKAIMKAHNYSEAVSLLQSTLDQLARKLRLTIASMNWL